MSGTLESIALQLEALNKNLSLVLKRDQEQDQGKPTKGAEPKAEPEDEEEAEEAAENKPAGKKVAAKKVAAKRKSKAKADDLSDMTEFKKRFFAIADASGVDQVMPKLKQFIKSEGYGTSDEIAVEDRAAFLDKVKDHFAELAGDAGEEGDDDGYDSL